MSNPSEKIQENYDKYYENHDSSWRDLGSREKIKPIIRSCQNQGIKFDKILDVGAGDGALIERLSENSFGKEYYAVEISQSAIDAIYQKDISGLVECKKFDGVKIPYEDNTFDLAILTHVLEHVEHTRILLYELARVSKHVFIEVPTEDRIFLKSEFVFDTTGHINYFSRKTIRLLLQSCDYEILEDCVEDFSKEAYTFNKGKLSSVHYIIKKIALKVSRTISTSIFCYRYNALSRTK